MTGYRDPFEDEPDTSLPLCPVCPSGRPWRVENRGHHGLECVNCRTIFRGTPDEMTHPKNRKRRQIIAEYAKHEADAAARRAK